MQGTGVVRDIYQEIGIEKDPGHSWYLLALIS
jgi:hypothetical protein